MSRHRSIAGASAALGRRRASVAGETPLNPADLGAKLKLWLDERGQTIATGVSPWADQSGNGYNFSNVTGTQQPATGTLINGYTAPKGDGSNDRLVTAVNMSSLISAGEHHVFAVLRSTLPAQTNANPLLDANIFGDAGGGVTLAMRSNGGSPEVGIGFFDGDGQKTLWAPSVANDTPMLVEWAHAGRLQTLQVSDLTTADPVVTSDSTGLAAIAVMWSNYAFGQFSAHALASLIVTNARLSATEVRGIRAYLSQKYAVNRKPFRTLGDVLLVGDSITVGYQGLTGGWRVNLAHALDAMGIGATFVGPYTDNGYAHRGVSGEKASGVSDLVSVLGTYVPDTVILAHGTNDLGAGDGVAALSTATQTLINQVQANRPSARIFLCSSVPPTSGPFYAYLADYTTWNGTTGPALAASEGIEWIDVGSPSVTDGVHPADTNTGYRAMARSIAMRIIDVL